MSSSTISSAGWPGASAAWSRRDWPRPLRSRRNSILASVGQDGLVQAAVGQAVGPLVERMAGVALDPAPVHLVTAGGFVEATPEVLVLHRALGHGAPAARLPQRH